MPAAQAWHPARALDGIHIHLPTARAVSTLPKGRRRRPPVLDGGDHLRAISMPDTPCSFVVARLMRSSSRGNDDAGTYWP
jgi:hypothetical protein